MAPGALPGVGVGGQGSRAYGIQITLPAIPLWLPDQARKELNDLIVDTMRLALQDVAGHVSDEAPRADGTLAQSFGADPATSTGGIEILGGDAAAGITGRVFSSLPYAIVMDQGRRPGAPISRAGIDAIGLWAQRKLGLGAAEADRAKWAIANVIVARGIAATNFFERGVKSATPRVDQLFAILGQQIAQRLVTAKGGA